jgi:hypothetical protein
VLPCALLRWELVIGCRRNLTEEALGDLVSPSPINIITTFLARLARALLSRPNRNGGLTIVLLFLTDVDTD